LRKQLALSLWLSSYINSLDGDGTNNGIVQT